MVVHRAAVVALEQLAADLVFQRRDPRRHQRLRYEELLSGSRHGPAADHGHKRQRNAVAATVRLAFRSSRAVAGASTRSRQLSAATFARSSAFGAITRMRSPCSTRVPVAATARATVPVSGAMIVDSIFIASIMATGVRAWSVVPACTATVTNPVIGGCDMVGIAGVGSLDADRLDRDRVVAHVERAKLAV
jgi:hypothetical protein